MMLLMMFSWPHAFCRHLGLEMQKKTGIRTHFPGRQKMRMYAICPAFITFRFVGLTVVVTVPPPFKRVKRELDKT